MDRTELDRLDRDILIKIAERKKLKVPKDAAKEYLIDIIVEECSDIREELDNIENAPMQVEKHKYDVIKDEELYNDLEEKELPDLSGESFFRLLLRDPFWAFCYWNIGSGIMEELLADDNFSGLFLKVYHYKTEDREASLDSYIIPVDLHDTSYYFSVSQGFSYSISLITQEADKEKVLLTSNTIDVPSLQIKPKDDDDFNLDSDILISLSAIGHREDLFIGDSPFQASSYSSVDFYLAGD